MAFVFVSENSVPKNGQKFSSSVLVREGWGAMWEPMTEDKGINKWKRIIWDNKYIKPTTSLSRRKLQEWYQASTSSSMWYIVNQLLYPSYSRVFYTLRFAYHQFYIHQSVTHTLNFLHSIRLSSNSSNYITHLMLTFHLLNQHKLNIYISQFSNCYNI